MPRGERPTEYYVHTLPGLESIAWDEIRQRAQAPSLLGFKVVPNRNGLVLFATPTPPSDLLRLRTAEDLFWIATRIADVPWGREGLTLIQERLARELRLGYGLGLLGSPRPSALGAPMTFRVVARIAGQGQPYRRIDLQEAVTRAVRQRTKRQWKAVEEGAQVELWANLLGRELLLGLRLSDERMRHRPYQQVHLPASLRPSVAAAMARLTEPQPDDVFVDPMCGTGTLLIERALYGQHGLLLGGDVDPAAVLAAQQNIGRQHKPRELFVWDARRLPLASGSVDRLASNLPFGKQLSRPSELPALYGAVAAEIARVLRPGGRAVLLTSEIRALREALQGQPELSLRRSYSVVLLGQRATIQLVDRLRHERGSK